MTKESQLFDLKAAVQEWAGGVRAKMCQCRRPRRRIAISRQNGYVCQWEFCDRCKGLIRRDR